MITVEHTRTHLQRDTIEQKGTNSIIDQILANKYMTELTKQSKKANLFAKKDSNRTEIYNRCYSEKNR